MGSAGTGGSGNVPKMTTPSAFRHLAEALQSDGIAPWGGAASKSAEAKASRAAVSLLEDVDSDGEAPTSKRLANIEHVIGQMQGTLEKLTNALSEHLEKFEGVLEEKIACAPEGVEQEESTPGRVLVSKRIQIEDFGSWHNAVVKSYAQDEDIYEVVYPVDGSSERLVLKSDGTAYRKGDAEQIRWRFYVESSISLGCALPPHDEPAKSATSIASATTTESDISMSGMLAAAKASKAAWHQSRARG